MKLFALIILAYTIYLNLIQTNNLKGILITDKPEQNDQNKQNKPEQKNNSNFLIKEYHGQNSTECYLISPKFAKELMYGFQAL